MIIQTGNRTDIPAFYSEWFANRLREGYVLVRNPFNPFSVTKYLLDPSIVDLIVFCTKNPGPVLRNTALMELLQSYHQYWFVTITPYGKDIEPNVPPVSSVMAHFRELSDIVGPGNMCWRYDPILLDTDWTIERHLSAFRSMCETLRGSARTVVISYIDLYEKVKVNYPEAKAVPLDTQLSMTKDLVRIASDYDMTVKPCGENPVLASVGADCSGCMTQKVFESAAGENLILPKVQRNRKECACYITNDIGAYNTCGHFCRYCYANADRNTILRNMRIHDPKSPFLIGHQQPEDVIHEPRQVSWIDPQMRLDIF